MLYEPDEARIEVLPAEVANRIAAGEVIERPESIIRELLDNAIDAGATEISVFLEEGGLKLIKIVDNGSGMRREDLELCHYPHSTSKLKKIEDLDNLYSLGFRGEALASIAASARLRIASTHKNEDSGYELYVDGINAPQIEPKAINQGTVIEVSDLFYAIPARKKFLKSAGAEFKRCKQIFIDKALSFPHVNFRLFHNKENVEVFIAESYDQRYVQILDKNEITLEHCSTISKICDNFSVSILAIHPSHYRKDKKGIRIYCNNRRIESYAFMQAVSYGYEAVLPGGLEPYACVFLEIEAQLIDFNIHPAKKEVKFRNQAAIHKAITSLLRDHLHPYQVDPYAENDGKRAEKKQSHPFASIKSPDTDEMVDDKIAPHEFSFNYENFKVAEPQSQISYQSSTDPALFSSAESNFHSPQISAANILPQQDNFKPSELVTRVKEIQTTSHDQPVICRYLGQLFNLYLLVEHQDALFIIDQHAAHETVLLHKIMSKPPASQQLLIPILFETESEQSELIRSKQNALKDMGIILREETPHFWTLESLPGGKNIPQDELIEILCSPYHEIEQLKVILYEKMACRLAIKKGETLSATAAEELALQTMELTQGRCPHGRPLWYPLSKEKLNELVLRTI